MDSLHAFFLIFAGILVFFTLISSLDELFVDLVYFLRVLPAKERYRPEYTEAFLNLHSEKPIAILVPAWEESDVIRRMLENAVRAYRYRSYEIFVGTYPNDLNTQREVDQVAGLFPHVHKVVVENPGPTCKADCLNGIYSAILEFEQRSGVRFEVFVQHDSEDVVHPLELKVFNLLIPESDMVQLPIFSGKVPWNFWTGGHYIGEFCEQHVKLMPVRDLLAGSVPGAGVGCGFSRRALEAMAMRSDGLPFHTGSLAEDYDLALRLSLSGFKTRFVSPVAVYNETACGFPPCPETASRNYLHARTVSARSKDGSQSEIAMDPGNLPARLGDDEVARRLLATVYAFPRPKGYGDISHRFPGLRMVGMDASRTSADTFPD